MSTAPLPWRLHLPPGLAPDQLDLLADGSLPGRWLRRWRELPDRPQLQDVDGTWISSDQLQERSARAAGALRRGGLEPGDRLVVCAESSADLVLAHMAALRAGLVVVPINPGYTDEEIGRLVRHAAPAAAVVDDQRRGAWIAEACPGPIPVLDVALAGPANGDVGIDCATAEDPALLVYTSGTTGKPKGSLLTHANVLASATAVNLAWRWGSRERLLLTLPLFHVHGLGVGVLASLCAGSEVLLRRRFDARGVAADCAEGVTMFFGVPAMYERLVAAGQAAALRPLRLLVCGSAPLPATLAEAVERDTGQIPLERYGMSETLMLTGNPHDGPRRPGTVGFPLPGVELELGEGGEVLVRGPNVITRYYEREPADAESFTPEGWFRTGDLGEIGEDGYLRLVGRSKELIITGGYNVHPREVEEVLAAHPGVVEVAVVGRASAAWGEEVTAVVVADSRIDVDELRALAATRLAPYKVPKRVEFASELPRNALGKVVRSRL